MRFYHDRSTSKHDNSSRYVQANANRGRLVRSIAGGSAEWAQQNTTSSNSDNVRRMRPHEPQKYVALSTQCVGVGSSGRIPMLARISIVDYRGNVMLDDFVYPTQNVLDYRTSITGLQPQHLWTAPSLEEIRHRIGEIFQNRILIGHCLWHHLSLIGICHPAIDTRDVALFLPFRRTLRDYSIIPLKHLVSHLMRRKIGLGYEHPLEEARAALDLFRSYEEPWEEMVETGSWPCALPPSAYREYFS